MVYKPFPKIDSSNFETAAIDTLLNWLFEVFKSFNAGKTKTLEFTTASGKVATLTIQDGLVIGYTETP